MERRVEKERGRPPVNEGGFPEEEGRVAAHMGGTRRFVFHRWRRQTKDGGKGRESPSGCLLAVPILDHGSVARNGERGGDGAR